MTEYGGDLNSIIKDVEISKTILSDFKEVRETHIGYRNLLKQIGTSLNRVNYLAAARLIRALTNCTGSIWKLPA